MSSVYTVGVLVSLKNKQTTRQRWSYRVLADSGDIAMAKAKTRAVEDNLVVNVEHVSVEKLELVSVIDIH